MSSQLSVNDKDRILKGITKKVGDKPYEGGYWGTDVVRDFIYVKDVVKGMLLILEKGESMRPYNLGSGDKTTIGDIVDNILEITSKSPKVEYDTSKPTTIPFKLSDTSRLENELGFKLKGFINLNLKW